MISRDVIIIHVNQFRSNCGPSLGTAWDCIRPRHGSTFAISPCPSEVVQWVQHPATLGELLTHGPWNSYQHLTFAPSIAHFTLCMEQPAFHFSCPGGCISWVSRHLCLPRTAALRSTTAAGFQTQQQQKIWLILGRFGSVALVGMVIKLNVSVTLKPTFIRIDVRHHPLVLPRLKYNHWLFSTIIIIIIISSSLLISFPTLPLPRCPGDTKD